MYIPHNDEDDDNNPDEKSHLVGNLSHNRLMTVGTGCLHGIGWKDGHGVTHDDRINDHRADWRRLVVRTCISADVTQNY